MTETYEEVATYPLRNRDGMLSDDFSQGLGDGMQNKSMKLETFDIARCVCLILMSIFFVCGANYFEPSTISYYDKHTPVKPTSFIAVAVIFYILFLFMECCKRASTGSQHAKMPCIGMFGAMLWFIATVSSFHVTGANARILSTIWIIGTVFNLIFVSYDMYTFIKTSPGLEKPLFQLMALFMAWLANVLFLAGGVYMTVLVTSIYISLCDLEKYAGLYIGGGVFYLIHAIFYTLSHFKGDITVTIKFGNSSRGPYHPGNTNGRVPNEEVCVSE